MIDCLELTYILSSALLLYTRKREKPGGYSRVSLRDFYMYDRSNEHCLNFAKWLAILAVSCPFNRYHVAQTSLPCVYYMQTHEIGMVPSFQFLYRKFLSTYRTTIVELCPKKPR